MSQIMPGSLYDFKQPAQKLRYISELESQPEEVLTVSLVHSTILADCRIQSPIGKRKMIVLMQFS